MKLKYKGHDEKCLKEFVVSEKEVGFCDIGDDLVIRIWNTVSGIPMTLKYKSLSAFLKDWTDI